MMRCALEDHFELNEFPNDFAWWCWDALGDSQLGEQLALLNPYQVLSLGELRGELLNAIEDRLWSLDRVPWCRPGLELHLVESRLIAFDTGERYRSAAALAEALPRISRRSLFFHVHEARRRTVGQTDDFSTWLESVGASPDLVRRLRSIDFYFLNLNQLRQQLQEAFRQYLMEPDAVMTGA
jgi:hypothetical protein